MSTLGEGQRVKEMVVDNRINKVLAMRTDSVAMLEALDAISEFYVVNSIDARRSLRQDLELQNISLAKKFLSEFEQVRQKLENVEDSSKKLESACVLLASRVHDADTNMKSFMEKASELEGKRNFYTVQSKEIELFLNRFQLSSEEIEILYRAPIDDTENANKFFDSLKRLCSAYNDCKEMVEKHCYSAGFELLDVLGQHQDMAYQRLFEWVKNKCNSLSESGSTEDVDVLMQTAVKYLRKLPDYFFQCQDLVVNSRRTQLVQKFVIALTQGSTSGRMSRAIDLHAHDSVRYVGDMLAWMHQAAASEEEFLNAVFGNNKEKGRVVNSNNSNDSNIDLNNTIGLNDSVDIVGENGNKELLGLNVQEMLARCLQGLGRPLRARIIQTLEGRAGLEALYTLTDLLCFYEITFNKVVPIENAVHSAIKGCLIECKRLFVSALNKQAESLVQSPLSYPLDFTASLTTKECCKQIHEILRVYGSALSPIPSDSVDPCYVDTVLGCIIQPLLQACRTGGKSLHQSDMAIFMLNNVSSIQNELIESSEKSNGKTSTWIDLLKTETLTWIDVLVLEETGRTLRRSDLDKLLELIEVLPEGFVAIDQPGLSQDRVSTLMRAFYASLFSTVAPQFERLQDPDLRELTRKRTAEAVANAHAKVCDVISNEKHNYDKSILSHTVNEVKVLLGL